MKPLFAILALSFGFLQAQDVRSADLKWTADQLIDLKDSSDFAYTCVFKTTSSGITWEQKSHTAEINVINITGQWTDIAQAGSIQYQVTVDGVPGYFKFERTATGLFVVLDCTGTDPQGTQCKFRISSIQAD